MDAPSSHDESHLGDFPRRVASQGPWDQCLNEAVLHGPPALPMPVKIAEPNTLTPVFQYLKGQQDAPSFVAMAGDEDSLFTMGSEPYYNVPYVEYEKGVVYLDRRLDLCKMVVGPPGIGPLMTSLETNHFIKHFLLGNNIIGPLGARHIAAFARKYPERMDTWYLAGNCIDAEGFSLLAQAWTKSKATNIWLKRNPLGPTAVENIAALITSPGCPRTLDLDQTELSDQGVADLFDTLCIHDGTTALQHLYLNGVGAGPKACQSIARYLAKPGCSLKSIYLGLNPIGDAGALALTQGLKNNQTLERLMLASVGLTSAGACALLPVLSGHAALSALDLGQSYATNDLNGRYNWLTDDVVPALNKLIENTPTLKYLNLSHTPISHVGLNAIDESIIRSMSLCWVFIKSIHPTTGTREIAQARTLAKRQKLHVQDRLTSNVSRLFMMRYDDFVAEEKRWLVGPKEDLRKIDSVYRNRDMGMARRRLRKLDKWWKPDDPTLATVMVAVQ